MNRYISNKNNVFNRYDGKRVYRTTRYPKIPYYANDIYVVANETDYLANRMKDHGILMSTDGPDHNVLKIKPPMVFNIQDADYLLESLEAVLKKIIR